MSKYLYQTVYEEFTGLKPPEPTDNKQRRKRGYGHPYRMRLNMQDAPEEKTQKKPERRNQFGQPINSARAKNRDSQEQSSNQMMAPQFNMKKTRAPREQREPRPQMQMAIPDERKGSVVAPKVTYKKRRRFSVVKSSSEETTQS
ncbi:hypothetical protein M3P05_18280 [Sansalvadorimonas sp. 2012CJ34-2]|uniref:Uncharacterized protein n=1 Tax=Parendozoicomonas callyspongiae TaxID=2942213 RepID=A0ABT0PKF7_9GAMM|nr:hypothetical protein [Sansalvadorimonas sp. 2012CJ34-2]MCL6271869.1 hypothetical protein [Sansalvadorimonas sp. 2012CJ34-2]